MKKQEMTRHWGRPKRLIGVIVATALLASASVLPAAHAAPAHGATSLSLWAPLSGPDGATFQKMVSQFNSSQRSVNISYTRQPETSYATTLKTALASGKGPDVWWDDGNDVVATYASAGKALALDRYISKVKDLQSKNFLHQVWLGGTYGGKVYGIPMDVLPLVLYYNKAVFRKFHLDPNKAPKDLKSFLSYGKKMTKKGAYGFVTPPGWPEQFVFPTMLAQFGGKEMDTRAKKSTINSSAGVAALKLLHDFIYKYKISPQNAAQDQDLRMIANKTAGMIVDGPWQYTNLHNALGNDLGVAPVPRWGKKKAVFLGTAYLSVNGSQSSKASAALKFADWFQKHAATFAKTGDLPTYTPVLHSSAFKKLSFEKTISSMLPYGVISPSFPNYGPGYGHFIYDAVAKALQGKSDPKSALNGAANNIDRAISSGG